MLKGLSESEVVRARKEYGYNEFVEPGFNLLPIVARQVKENPLSLVLLGASIVSFLIGEKIGSVYIFIVVVVSVVLGFWNEYKAEKTVQRLLKKISHKAAAIRDGRKFIIPVRELVVGDMVYLEAGDVVPADIEISEGSVFEVDEASITGESLGVTKNDGKLLMGTLLVGGAGYGQVTKVGAGTEFGKIVNLSAFATPQTEFQKGLSLFGSYLTKLVLVMTTSMFVINFLLGKNILTSLLFSLAVAMGLTPELMPVIVTVSLAYGASRLAKKHVITKKLVSIENLGNMDILCTDKTGTLTEGKLFLADSKTYLKSVDILTLSRLAATKANGKNINPIDQAIWEGTDSVKDYALIKDIPFDFNRRASMVVIEKNSDRFIVLKGAPIEIMALSLPSSSKKNLERDYLKQSSEGLRVIAVAYKKTTKKKDYDWSDAKDMEIAGYLVFADKIKESAREAISEFEKLNVMVKILTGDNEHVAKKLAGEMGMVNMEVVLGEDVEKMSDEELTKKAKEVMIFARLLPAHKIRIINVLRASGEAVGYLGDGINDVPSLRAADVGISVDDGVDAAKDAASIVLLKKDLRVLASGVEEGRKTFNNTIKYILMSTSSSFGNMISLFFISVFVKFLPLTALQIIINDGLYDAAQTAIPTDNVDTEALKRPEHWDIGFIRKYMTFFGPLSSLYDLVPFVIFYFVFNARGSLFQTTWFIQSLATQVLVVFVIRTVRKPFFTSRPSMFLVLTSLSVILVSVLLPLSPIASVLGFVRLPTYYYAVLVGVVAGWLILADNVKGMVLKKIFN